MNTRLTGNQYWEIFISLCVSRQNNEKDVNAVAVVRPKPDQVQTERAVDFHPNILNKEFEVIGHVPKLMATWLTRFLKRHTNNLLWESGNKGEAS